MADESLVYTVDSGLPIVSSCDGDLPKFASDLHAYIVRGFSQVYAALAQKERGSYDLCRDLDVLRATQCLIAETGIDQSEFTYAATKEQVIEPGTGVLPFVEYPQRGWYRAGATMQSVDADVSYTIRPSIPDSYGVNFGVYLSAGNPIKTWLSSPSELRKNSGIDDKFNIHSMPNGEGDSVWVYWLLLPF